MPPKGVRLQPVRRPATQLQARLQDYLDNRPGVSVQTVADEWEIPYWVIRDTARGSTDCPRGLYLPAMARGLGITIEMLIEDAYTPYREPVTA